MKIKKIVCFANGNAMVFDEEGKQVTTLQASWLMLYIDFLKAEGIDPEGLKIIMPNKLEAKIFKVKDGYNWGFKKDYFYLTKGLRKN